MDMLSSYSFVIRYIITAVSSYSITGLFSLFFLFVNKTENEACHVNDPLYSPRVSCYSHPLLIHANNKDTAYILYDIQLLKLSLVQQVFIVYI